MLEPVSPADYCFHSFCVKARSKLRHHNAAVQVPIGLEEEFEGLVDLVEMKAYKFEGSSGQNVTAYDVPSNMADLVNEKRRELIEVVSEVDDQLAEAFLNDEPITANQLKAAIRRATVARKFIPVYMGSAFKNKGVQPLLDGVLDYLPCPLEVDNYALDQNNSEEKVLLAGTPAEPLVALAFKLEEGRFGQLTYLRIYDGVIRKGDFIYNVNTGKKIKVRLNSNFHVPARQLSHCFLLLFEQGPLKALTIGYSNIFNLKDHKRLLVQYAMRNIKGAYCIDQREAF